MPGAAPPSASTAPSPGRWPGYDVLVSLSHDPAADVAVAFVVLRQV